MSKNHTINFKSWLSVGLQRISVFHFLLLLGYGIQIILFDSTKVITAEVVLWRWLAAGSLLVITAGVWYLAHNQNNSVSTYKRLIFMLLTADILFASFNVFTQRGMASRAVIIYVLAIITSAILLSRSAIIATSILAAVAYSLTALSYRTLNFNEGYIAEIYGEVLFYCFVFFIFAGLLSAIVKFGGDTSKS